MLCWPEKALELTAEMHLTRTKYEESVTDLRKPPPPLAPQKEAFYWQQSHDSIKSPSAPFIGPRCFMEDFKLPDRRKLATTPITNVRIDGAHSSFQILRGIFSLRTRCSRSPEVARRACNRVRLVFQWYHYFRALPHLIMMGTARSRGPNGVATPHGGIGCGPGVLLPGAGPMTTKT